MLRLVYCAGHSARRQTGPWLRRSSLLRILLCRLLCALHTLVYMLRCKAELRRLLNLGGQKGLGLSFGWLRRWGELQGGGHKMRMREALSSSLGPPRAWEQPVAGCRINNSQHTWAGTVAALSHPENVH